MCIQGVYNMYTRCIHGVCKVYSMCIKGKLNFLTDINCFRLAFDGDEAPDLLKECYIRDIHCISSLLKMYFR